MHRVLGWPIAAIRYLRRLHLRHWGWIHAKLALGLGWGHAIILFTPVAVGQNVAANTIAVTAIGTGVGSIVAVIGMLMSLANERKTALNGLWVEVVGAVLLAGGPLQYMGIQIGFLIDSGDFENRYALSWFAYAMFAFVIVRFTILLPELIRELRKKRERRV